MLDLIAETLQGVLLLMLVIDQARIRKHLGL